MEFNNSVHPTKEQMEGFLEGDTDTPIAMVNLLKFKKKLNTKMEEIAISQAKKPMLYMAWKSLNT